MKAWKDLQPVARLFGQATRGRLWLGAGLATLTVLAGIALLGVSGWFITATALAGLATASALAFNVFVPSAAIRLLALGRTAGRYAERLVTHDATLAVLAALREQLFRGWAQPEAARALLRQPARLLFRLTGDVDALEVFYLRLLVPALAAFGAALLAGGVLGSLDLWLGLALALWLLLAGWGIAALVVRRARSAAWRRAVALERLRSRAIDLVSGQTDLVMAGRLAAQCTVLDATDARLARADRALQRLETRAGWAYSVAGTLALAGVLLAAGLLAGRGTLNAPAAALALLVTLSAMEPFAALRRGAIEAGRSWLAARRLAPRLQAGEGAPAMPDPVPADGVALVVHEARVTYPGVHQPTPHPLSLHIAVGEQVAVIGPSGAGKSTLLALAAAELRPSAGTVRALPSTWLTQRTELFQDSLRDNLRLADPQAHDERLWAVLEAAGLAADVRALPNGLDTPLGEGGLGLSGGQMRRLALARLLLRPTPLWLLDEPTEGLDPPIARDVLQRLRSHAQGRTLLIATHLRREAALADRLLVFRQGRLADDLRRGSAGFAAALQALRPD